MVLLSKVFILCKKPLLCGGARWKVWLGEAEVVGCSPAMVGMEAVYDSPTSAEEHMAVMGVSAQDFARGFYVNLCVGAGWKEWLGEAEVVGGSPATVRMEALPTKRRRSERRQGCNGGCAMGFCSWFLHKFMRWGGLERVA